MKSLKKITMIAYDSWFANLLTECQFVLAQWFYPPVVTF